MTKFNCVAMISGSCDGVHAYMFCIGLERAHVIELERAQIIISLEL